MSKNLSAKYYQGNKRRQQKKLVKNIKIFIKKKKNEKCCCECYKNLLKIKRIDWLSTQKNFI